ncbi:MAG: COX15/CtaA family protein [Burkholderiaceae bacterium]
MDAFDLLLLAFKGIAIASLPLALVWIGRAPREHGDRLRRLAWVTAFFTFDLIVFGGFTRLTDSGLGCPDWPGCYAKANPFMAASDIHAAETAMPTGPVTMNKAWIEMIHRYLAMAVGVLIIAMLIASIVRVRRAAKDHGAGVRIAFPDFVACMLGLVVLQGAFGAWTVTQKLQPIFVSTHLLLGLALLAMLVWHALRLEGVDDSHSFTGATVLKDVRGLRAVALLGATVLAVQIALGGWVSANYAVLACTDFPTCQGVWFPQMDFVNGFHLWRGLGRTAGGGYLSAQALTAIHWAHRSFAGIVLVVLGTLAWRARRMPSLVGAASTLAGLLAAQFASGLVNVVFAWPLLAAVLHNAGAAGLVACLVVINYRVSVLSRLARVAAADFHLRAQAREALIERTAS